MFCLDVLLAKCVLSGSARPAGATALENVYALGYFAHKSIKPPTPTQEQTDNSQDNNILPVHLYSPFAH